MQNGAQTLIDILPEFFRAPTVIDWLEGVVPAWTALDEFDSFSSGLWRVRRSQLSQ